MRNFFNKNLGGIILVLFSALIGYAVNAVKESSSNKKRYIDCWKNVSYSNINKSDLVEKNIQILINGKPVNNLSSIDVKLYNFSDKNFADIPVYIELIPAKGDSLQLIEEDVDGIGKNIESMSADSIHPIIGGFKFAYLIKAANTADSLRHSIFNGSFSITSNKKPNFFSSWAVFFLASSYGDNF